MSERRQRSRSRSPRKTKDEGESQALVKADALKAIGVQVPGSNAGITTELSYYQNNPYAPVNLGRPPPPKPGTTSNLNPDVHPILGPPIGYTRNGPYYAAPGTQAAAKAAQPGSNP